MSFTVCSIYASSFYILFIIGEKDVRPRKEISLSKDSFIYSLFTYTLKINIFTTASYYFNYFIMTDLVH